MNHTKCIPEYRHQYVDAQRGVGHITWIQKDRSHYMDTQYTIIIDHTDNTHKNGSLYMDLQRAVP